MRSTELIYKLFITKKHDEEAANKFKLDQRDSSRNKTFALDLSNPGLIQGTAFGPLSTEPEVILDTARCDHTHIRTHTHEINSLAGFGTHGLRSYIIVRF